MRTFFSMSVCIKCGTDSVSELTGIDVRNTGLSAHKNGQWTELTLDVALSYFLILPLAIEKKYYFVMSP